MNSVKARENYEAALSLLPELKEEQSVPQLFKVVRHVFSMNSLLRLMGDKDSVSIWKQRIDDLHAQLASSVVKFLQQFSPTKEQFGNACLSLLYVGAEACERLEQEKETLLSQLLLEKEKYTELHKRFQSQLKDTALKENLELRTRLVVQQQNMIQREAETRELVQHLQHTLAEKNSLLTEKERLAGESARNFQILERQATAISQLMDECENNVKEKDQALKSLQTINEDNKILTINLERHSKVIENLINVNAEMIEAANSYAQMQDWDERHPREAHHLPIDSKDDNGAENLSSNSRDPAMLSGSVETMCENSSCTMEESLNSSDVLKETVPGEEIQKARTKGDFNMGRQHPTFC